ncbi:MAG: HNH endonuclease [Vicingus serpentipes]|nr:HNH endonuclease [Vicingus serpentipes]
MKKGSAGGKVTAIINRERSLLRYYNSPNYCIHCNKIIVVKDNEKAAETRKRKFCSRSCANTHNNLKIKSSSENRRICPLCGKKKNTYSTLCIKCFNKSKEIITSLTKGELFDKYRNWQSARSTIQSNARKVLIESGREMKCVECEYSLHVDCCHIKDVSEFSSDSLISEINDTNNLVWLCKNHHWEFDNELLKLKNK